MTIQINGQTIFAFSDTHGHHRDLRVPENADILICAGDAVEDDLKGCEYDDFIDWFSSQKAKWKIFVPGNHELSFDLGQSEPIENAMTDKCIIVLQDAVEDCDGVIIGAISGNARIADEEIPSDLDILVTHYPPLGILDQDLGSPEILNFVLKAKPKHHLFGHIHATEGKQYMLGQTCCENISCYLLAVVPRLAGPAGKFLGGIHRWMREGDISLNTATDYERLNILLHIMEDHPAFYFYDEDFNGQSRDFVEKSLSLDYGEQAYERPAKTTYNAVQISSYDEALKYLPYTPDWCILISDEAYREHTRDGKDRFYFLERSDMKAVPRMPGSGFPKDEYGLSLIAVCVAEGGDIISITSRWNYGDNQDFFLSAEELKGIVGNKMFQIFSQK